MALSNKRFFRTKRYLSTLSITYTASLNRSNNQHDDRATLWVGGLGENRDCSAFIRDIFTQYGIYLPRNSKAQVSYGNNSIDLKTLSSKEKEAFIIANATPYMTLLWQQGHIMLYIGQYQGKALIAHSAWSVITGKKYENMLGVLSLPHFIQGKSAMVFLPIQTY